LSIQKEKEQKKVKREKCLETQQSKSLAFKIKVKMLPWALRFMSEHPNIPPLNYMVTGWFLFLLLAFLLLVNHIRAKPGPSFSANGTLGCPLSSKHASSPIYL
jgi:hypothetical protein